jgi:APA family basic amino acid/polyamine antiporter
MNLQQLFRTKSIDKIMQDSHFQGDAALGKGKGLKKELGVVDLTSLGIAAIVGAGIFSTIGNAAFHGGPAVVFLFIFTAIACVFSALCYAEFASTLPVSGSAYTYAYATMGELIAWIIGWDLLMEYAIGNIAVAISWSDYFTSLLAGYGIHFPTHLSMDTLSAARAYEKVLALVAQTPGSDLISLFTSGAISQSLVDGYTAWTQAPRVFGMPLIFDLPAVLVTILVTWVVYIGIKESRNISNMMVLLKIGILILVIGLGAFYVSPAHWDPFAPNGVTGILKGVSGVFFAYIGFDAISTTAEECKNPQRDLPKAMIYSLIICTILYIFVALVLTGMVSYEKLAVGDPLAYVFGPEGVNINWVSGVIAISAVIALFSVLLVFQLGQPRIWMSMGRDGLLPKIFSAIHPKYQTPWFATIVTGFLVAIPCLFMNLTEVTDLTSIGTLFAFFLVSIGVLRLDPNRPRENGRFRIPYVNGKFWFPAILLGALLIVFVLSPETIQNVLQNVEPSQPEAYGWEVFKHRIPLFIYFIMMGVMVVLTFKKNFSLIPLLGAASTGYLMTELGIINWIRFVGWLIVGLIIYFSYGIRNSKLAK